MPRQAVALNAAMGIQASSSKRNGAVFIGMPSELISPGNKRKAAIASEQKTDAWVYQVTAWLPNFDTNAMLRAIIVDQEMLKVGCQ